MTVDFKQRPVGEMIAVELAAAPRDQKILLPDWQRVLEGTVVAVGPGVPLESGGFAPMECKVGDRVVFGAATGMESVYCGATIRIMRDSDVDAVLA